MVDNKYIVKRVYSYDGTPCETIITAPMNKQDCEKVLNMYQHQYQSTQYIMEEWEA